MEESIRVLLRGTSKLPYTSIGKEVTIEDAEKVWKTVEVFIHENICKNKSVVIRQIGTFCVKETKIPLAHNPLRYLFKRTPMFYAASQMCLYFRIKPSRAEDIPPITFLNPSTIAQRCHISRHKVNELIKEIIVYIYRCLAANSEAKLPIHGIGTVIFRSDAVKVSFEKSFLTEIQGNDLTEIHEPCL
ncbi:uncharacterized protein LOC118196780 [Stegodyphus dumicola]|uniref:uncharacterized protein LOC118196780 n=1 Tax=Stegodyphus dumicola TaxID=202533 RepID=UPI0015B13662|nr:uncharacterized protein LOC118196780 [Stegodyphus dumicola]